jgi:hypothetical protein
VRCFVDGKLLDRSALRRLGDLFANCSLIQEQGFSPLHTAVLQKRSKDLRSMLEFSTNNIDCRGHWNLTTVYWAGITLNSECMELLLQYGADASIAGEDGQRILHILAYSRPNDQRTCELWDPCLRLLIQHVRGGRKTENVLWMSVMLVDVLHL